MTWNAQRPLASRFTVVVPTRSGYAPIPAETEFPKLAVSGAQSAAFDAVCDVLEERLRAERAVVPGAGHSIPRAPGFNDVVLDFLERSIRGQTP
jgi:hypothetical protein